MAQYTLWGRKVDLLSIPTEGTRMAMLTSEDGPVHTPIVEVYLNFDGTPNVTLEAVIVDPDEEGEKFFRRPLESNLRNRRGRWDTGGDGDPLLRGSGWLPYEEWPEAWRG